MLHKRSTLTFDIDGVIADTAFNAVSLFNKKFSQNKIVDDLKNFFIISEWVFEITNDKESSVSEAIKIWNDETVLTEAKPIEGSVELVKHLLKEDQNDVFFVTSRPGFVRNITVNWFARWLPFVDSETILMGKESDGLQRSFKKDKIAGIGPDVHFEDSVEHALDILEAAVNTRIILVSQPWNIEVRETLPDRIFVSKQQQKRDLFKSYREYLALKK